MRKFKITVSTNKIGSTCTRIIEMDDEDVPEDFKDDPDFHAVMEEEMWNTGLVEWDFEEVEQ